MRVGISIQGHVWVEIETHILIRGSASSEVDSEGFSGNAIIFVYDHTYSHMGVPFSEDGAFVIIAFITPEGQNILRVVHPPVKHMRRSKISSSPINYFPAAAV